METTKQQGFISISVLPFQNLSDDSRIDLFCTGLLMDITTDLSRFRSFRILPAEDKASLPEDLDYLVKGIARFRNDRLQVNIQLIQVKENRLVWAEKFEDALEHIFQIEEEIIQKIVLSLQQVVDYDLLAKIRKRPLADLSAYEHWLYGMEELKRGTQESDEKAREFFQEAIALDAGFARAYSGMSLTYFNEWSCLLWDSWEENQKGAIEWALKAVALDAWDPANAYVLGKCYLFYKQYNKAEFYLRKALQLNPANPVFLAGISFCMAFLGFPEEALDLYQQAEKLDPSRRGFILTGTFVYFENGLFEQAKELGTQHHGSTEWIDFQATLAAVYYELGELDKMWACWQEYVQYFHQKIKPEGPINERLALEWMMTINPYQRGTQHQAFWDYMKDHLKMGDLPAPHTNQTVPESAKSAHNQLSQEGTIWKLSYQGKSTQMSDLKGLHVIARLLEQPQHAIHCTDLMGMTVLENGAPVFDEKAKKAYQHRLLEIQESLQEAEQFQHHGEIARLQQEYDELLTHLSQSVGKGGKSRKASDSLEKARSAVTWRIRSAIKKIESIHPEMAAHFSHSIKTGVFCTYQPEHLTTWLT